MFRNKCNVYCSLIFGLLFVLNQTFQSCTVKMILPLKVALCLGFNQSEVSKNNQTKLLEKSV